MPLRSFGPHLPHAVIAAEDARFYEHDGVDWPGMRQAAEDNWRRGRLWRGGSTITQQLVKNLFLTTYGSFLRKLVEIPLALLAELILGKPRILELYLNEVEWGPGVYGGAAAAEQLLRRLAAFLSREQAARLAACLPAPRTRRPQRMNAYAAQDPAAHGQRRLVATLVGTKIVSTRRSDAPDRRFEARSGPEDVFPHPWLAAHPSAMHVAAASTAPWSEQRGGIGRERYADAALAVLGKALALAQARELKRGGNDDDHRHDGTVAIR